MASVKIVLRNEEKADGTYPLAIRVTKDRKSSFIYLDYSIKPSEWDKDQQRVKRACPNHVRLNNYLIKKLSEATDKALELETNKADVSVKAVRNMVKPKIGASFFPQAQAYLDALKVSGKYNEYTSNKSRIGHFKEFMKNEDISFNDVTVGCLDNFVVYLRARTIKSKKGKVKKLGERSIMNHLSAIRSVFAYAKRQEVIDGRHSPFGKGKSSHPVPGFQKRRPER